jgi:putative component of membrane protein insertase Oxa1/YidC/SpoIIIJ protein YidD
MHSPATLGGVWAIDTYQRWISPYKGFHCAHHARTGGLTCSGFAKAAIREHGLFAALPRIRDRLIQCSEYATDPMKGKISEDDPGPLRGCSDSDAGCIEAAACAGCASFDLFS